MKTIFYERKNMERTFYNSECVDFAKNYLQNGKNY